MTRSTAELMTELAAQASSQLQSALKLFAEARALYESELARKDAALRNIKDCGKCDKCAWAARSALTPAAETGETK